MAPFFRTLSKALILLKIFVGTIALGEPLVPDGEITNVLTTLHIFSSYEEMRKDIARNFPSDKTGPVEELEGMSDCWRNEEQNIAYCDIWMVRPSEVDDEHTLTLGHEVLHGVYGNFHK